MQFEFSRKPKIFSSLLQEIRLQNISWSRGSPNYKIKKRKILCIQAISFIGFLQNRFCESFPRKKFKFLEP